MTNSSQRNRIDWDNSNKLGSQTVQWLIPTNKQTNTHPAEFIESKLLHRLRYD